MPIDINGQLTGNGLRIGIAAARFNGTIVADLIDGAVDGLVRHGVVDADITIARCPGTWELPLVAQRLATKRHAVIALGAVIRGETSHYDHVIAGCVKGLADAQIQTGIPIIFGVITTDTVEQAVNRAGIKHGNKGFEAAMAAIEMARVLAAL